MTAVGCPAGATPPCFATCKPTSVGGGWNCAIDHSHPIIGRREGKENRAILHTLTDVEGNRAVVCLEMLGGPVTLEKWILPAAPPMTEHRNDDWHGQASVWLPSDMPKAEVASRLAIARAIHGPKSRERCCVAHRERLALAQQSTTTTTTHTTEGGIV